MSIDKSFLCVNFALLAEKSIMKPPTALPSNDEFAEFRTFFSRISGGVSTLIKHNVIYFTLY